MPSKKVVQEAILSWYSKNKRDLPWRKTKDPYHILVSELMLQQTQVPRVIPKYHAFLKKFPTVKKLAKASPAQVIDEWAGLGYNRRALYLHKFAVAVGNGNIPSTPEELEKLPGIGPYTAGAVACFGFGKDVPVVDINIKRIFSRLFFTGEGTDGELNQMAASLVPAKKGVAWNNALMDFGSMICSDKPQCDSCPLKRSCSAFNAGVPEKYVKPKKQSKFKGSNRYYRSMIVKELRKSNEFSLPLSQINKLKPKEKDLAWWKGIIDSLERDGLIVKQSESVSLPK